jgi:general secretion pathway protein G
MQAEREARVHSRDAFTLIEIMAVVIIIGLLTTIVGAAIFQQVDKGRIATARAQINNLEGVLELYRMDNGRFPSSEQGLEALVHAPSGDPAPRNYPPGGYLKGGRVPPDPWGNPYHYEEPGQHNQHSFDLWSEGADGTAGGEGTDADIGNWAEGAEPS